MDKGSNPVGRRTINSGITVNNCNKLAVEPLDRTNITGIGLNTQCHDGYE